MAKDGASSGGDLGACKALAAQSRQTPRLGASRSQVEAAACSLGGLERVGALFDAYRTAMAHLCPEPSAMESSDARRHGNTARATTRRVRMAAVALQPHARA